MGKIAILIGFLPNPRMLRRIALEKRIGELHVICWDKGNNLQEKPIEDGFSLHVISRKAGPDPVKRIIPYVMFARDALRLLKEIQPEILDVQSLDMLRIADSYQRESKQKVHIIYEIADLHYLLVDEQKNPIKQVVQKYLRWEDRRLAGCYEWLLLTSMKYYEAYFREFVPLEKIFYMPNVPDLAVFHEYHKKDTNGEFTVGYIGSVRYKKQMRNLIEAARQCGIHLMVAGFECEPIEIEPLCKDDPNIEWIGRFDFNARAAELYGRCDVMYSVYDADMRNVRVALPNKLYESTYCEIPLIVAKNTYLAQVVEDWGVGVAVDHKSVEELAGVLQDLRDHPEMRDKISLNCRKHRDEIDLQFYNEQLQKRLLSMLGISDGRGDCHETCAGDH